MKLFTIGFYFAVLVCAALAQDSKASWRLDKDIDEQLDLLAEMSRESGLRLSGNEDLYYWIVDQGPRDELPSVLEIYWNQMTRRNMKQRLFSLYRWIDGTDFTRQRYFYWLTDLVDWFQRYTGSTKTLESRAPKYRSRDFGWASQSQMQAQPMNAMARIMGSAGPGGTFEAEESL